MSCLLKRGCESDTQQCEAIKQQRLLWDRWALRPLVDAERTQ